MLGDALDLQKMSAVVREWFFLIVNKSVIVKSKFSKISMHENYDWSKQKRSEKVEKWSRQNFWKWIIIIHLIAIDFDKRVENSVNRFTESSVTKKSWTHREKSENRRLYQKYMKHL